MAQVYNCAWDTKLRLPPPPWSPAVLESAFTFYCQLLKLALCDAVSICAQNFPALVCWGDLQMEYATHPLPPDSLQSEYSTPLPSDSQLSNLPVTKRGILTWHGTRQEYQIQTTPVIKPVSIWNISENIFLSDTISVRKIRKVSNLRISSWMLGWKCLEMYLFRTSCN